MPPIQQYSYDGAVCQCAQPGCLYVAAVDDAPTVCPFHGHTAFVYEITSPLRLSKRRRLFVPFDDGSYMALYFTSHGKQFAGILYHNRGLSKLIESDTCVGTGMPKEHRKIAHQVFQLLAGDNAVPPLGQVKECVSETVKCAICGYEAASLTKHLKEKHKCTPTVYKAKYPLSRVISDKVLLEFASNNGIARVCDAIKTERDVTATL